MAANTFYMKERSKIQKFKDFIALPLRAVALFEVNKWGLTSTQAERFEYAAKEVRGHCLDIGCGKYNLFVQKYAIIDYYARSFFLNMILLFLLFPDQDHD